MSRRGKTYALFTDLQDQVQPQIRSPVQSRQCVKPRWHESTETDPVPLCAETTVCDKQLWLALYFFDFPLEVLCRGKTDEQPVVVVAEKCGKSMVIACNQYANNKGIQVGLTLASAYAMSAHVLVLAQNLTQERVMLKRLGAWAKQYTPLVSLEWPQALLLEIKGSLALFGGLQQIIRLIETDLRSLGFKYHTAIAPTPTAALWLGRYHHGKIVQNVVELNRQLGGLTIKATHWPTHILNRLQGMGVCYLRDCMRLPRDGLARRIGQQYLLELDHALGKSADPRKNYIPPDKFVTKREFTIALESEQRVFIGLEQLIKQLVDFLRSRQCGIQNLVIKLHHQKLRASCIELGMASISRDGQRMATLIQQKLEQLTLPAPVIAVTMMSGRLYDLSGRDGVLFDESDHNPVNWPELVEKLRARLGAQAVTGMCLIAEHRPERAWKYSEPGTHSKTLPCLQHRPLWVFSKPYQLSLQELKPQWHGKLRMLCGPERIESGWWDGQDAARDYYIALNPQGLYLWVYRQRETQARQTQQNVLTSQCSTGHSVWYAHGIFA